MAPPTPGDGPDPDLAKAEQWLRGAGTHNVTVAIHPEQARALIAEYDRRGIELTRMEKGREVERTALRNAMEQILFLTGQRDADNRQEWKL